MSLTHRRSQFIAVLFALLAQGQLALPVSAADWPQFRGPGRDGKSAETGLLAQWPPEGPKLLWTATGVGAGFSHVSVASGLVYVTGLVGKEGILQALNPDGTVKWRASYGPEYSAAHPGARSVPTVHDGLVYVASGLGNVSCFEAATGTPVWSVKVFEQYEAPQVQWGYAESLLVDGEKVIVTPCGKKATMVALDRKTGAAVWASPALEQASSFCSPLLIERGGQRLLITMTEVAVLAFSAIDGRLVWQHPYQNPRQNHPDMPLYHDGLLYVTSGYGKGAI
ncbi:MAG: PQQ-binding-like beta-propeller repeat protein, partial [Armatimonadota bacterium]